VKITPYYSLVNNYIDAQCLAASCPSNQYNYLTLINQDAYLYGLDLSGFAALGTVRGIGSFTARGMIAYVRGKNRDTGDYLYNIMPLNARLTLEHRLGNWTNTIEEQLVSAKDDVSRTRSEISTSGYSLLNLRSSYEWKNVRVDIGLDNALDKQYALPLGGAYIGQGMTMSIGPPPPGRAPRGHPTVTQCPGWVARCLLR
jgi:iron complex outermembrane receptor protein